ncbi:MAG TPA: ABC transporter permease [Bacillota bacterium]|nr:ABC transporter permease [Bacillota bacterium]HPZ78627.1 ABC transporter permease [Bacillota bacterium]HQD74947.1 ABC transporter permease [Bacillota bacterium]
MLGMKRSTLFAMLMGETIWNSLISILIGLPIALFLTEGISLATVKLVGLGIIGHRISFSISAVIGTVIGFIAVQMIAMLLLSASFSRKEPMELLRSDSPEKQVPLSTKKGWLCFIVGLVFLILAYVVGVTMLRSFDFNIVMLIIILGGGGTFLLYRGMGIFIGHNIQRKSPMRSGLFTFTGRQIHENVIHQYKALAISSLLLVMALACVSFGIGTASGRGSMEVRTVDFSIEGSEQEVREVLDSEASKSIISEYYPMFLSRMNTNLYDQSGEILEKRPEAHDFSWDGLNATLAKLPETDLRNNMIESFSDRSGPYLISKASYNELLQAIGKEQIQLKRNQVALYTSMKDSGDFMSILNGALELGAYIEVDDQKYELLSSVYYDNVVADRKITLYSALIVPDEDYRNWVSGASTPFCWNVVLSQELVNDKGLMQAIQLMEQNLAGTGLEYETFLSGIGRNLFYTVAASYLTIYLGILFMVIANTVIGLKYLMQQRANERRYTTLLMLGANVSQLCKSARSQIRMFFALALSVAVCSSIFAIWSMFTSFLKLPAGTSIVKVIAITGIAAVLFVVIELIYIHIVERASSREIQALQVIDRG